jgi:hypothetical protein
MGIAIEQVGPVGASDGAIVSTEAPADFGLLTHAEVVAALRGALGDAVSAEQIEAAATAVKDAEAAHWEMMPQGIDPDMGFNFFVVCRETCWLARQILLFGSTFRIFKLRD